MDRADSHIEVIVRAVWIEQGRVLLCRNIKGGYCYLPGGHVEVGEAAGEALQRELLEECGMHVRVGQCLLVGESSFVQGAKARHEINLVFHVEHGSSDANPMPIASLEPHIAFEWVGLSELANVDCRPEWLTDRVGEWLKRLDVVGPSGPEWSSVMSAT